ncbi:NAD-dependent epimerase/dehydratase family protein [Mycobacterium sp. CBMA271]|uniref:NAD-dependent epimerase/dehydratase family protein n=1 Tax=unclassified Mycobacteroides TaxID=2618759 RepID=UPI0012DF6F41|nr:MULTISPECIES: NAD-dependent epimerase/dehydratase family protein [unclassified Mycobacteroides]MUM17038.1 oxidoreductase [Mycobacteroides sp. CBMA 326]MUM23274.1 NAD-dependent epimerase/dehydratase family protein [Mycobacteroides sp. CBMA 271]
MTQRAFVTGANGFVGRTLSRRLRALGWQVCGVDLVADPAHDVRAGDINTDGPWVADAAAADTVFHTAAVVSNTADAETAWRINVLGTKKVIDATSPGTVFVHLSSVRAFSDLDFPDMVAEEHPVRTDGNTYVDTKIASEQLVLQSHGAGRIDARIARPGDIYGPGSRPWTILPVEMIRSRQFVLPAMGRGIFSPVYVDDVVDGIVSLATNRAASGQVFTISGGTGVTCAQFFGHYYRMLGRRGPLVLPTAVALGLARTKSAVLALSGRTTEANASSVRYLTRNGTYSIAKAQSMLGYNPQFTLDTGMQATETWLRNQGLLD